MALRSADMVIDSSADLPGNGRDKRQHGPSPLPDPPGELNRNKIADEECPHRREAAAPPAGGGGGQDIKNPPAA
jgi:hypothetical protein